MWDFLLDVIFPRRCVSCGSWGQFICNNCRKKINYFESQVCPYCERQSPYGLTHPRCQKPQGLSGMFVLSHYEGPVKAAIHLVKYQSTYAITYELAQLIGERYHFYFDFDYFVPIPLHPRRETERGFNQAEKLARQLHSRFKSKKNTPVAKLLERTRDTRPQFDLKYEQRKSNLVGAFGLSRRLKTRNLKTYSFCLVDDVATTGATIFECAKVLKRSGAKEVFAITIARGG